jgi:hypothetical protein
MNVGRNDISEVEQDSRSRWARRRRKIQLAVFGGGGIVLLGALPDAVYWKPPPSWFPGSDGDHSAFAVSAAFYLCLAVLVSGCIWMVNKAVKLRAPLDYIKRLDNIENPGILVLLVSRAVHLGPVSFDEMKLHAAEFAPLSADGDELVHRIGAVAAICAMNDSPGRSWSPQLSLLVDALKGGKLRGVLFVCSDESHQDLERSFGGEVLPSLRNGGIDVRLCIVEPFDVKNCYETILDHLDELHDSVGRMDKKAAQTIVIDSNGGTGQMSVAAALVSMREGQTYTYKQDKDGPRRVYDMKPAQRSTLLSSFDV